MARPVNGYLAKDGAFFKTYHECCLYEATFDCREVTNKFIIELLPAAEYNERVVFADMLMKFIAENADVVGHYARLKNGPPPYLPEPVHDEGSESGQEANPPSEPFRETGSDAESAEDVHI